MLTSEQQAVFVAEALEVFQPLARGMGEETERRGSRRMNPMDAVRHI